MEALDRTFWISDYASEFAGPRDDPLAVYGSLYDFHLTLPPVDQVSSLRHDVLLGRSKIFAFNELRDGLDGVSDAQTPLSHGLPYVNDDEWFAVVALQRGAPVAGLVGFRAHHDAPYAEIALLWTARTLSIGSPLISQLELMSLWFDFMHLAATRGHIGLSAKIVDPTLRAMLTSSYPRFLLLKSAVANRRDSVNNLSSVPKPSVPQFELVVPSKEGVPSTLQYFVLPTNGATSVTKSDRALTTNPWRIRPTVSDLARWNGTRFAVLFESGLIAQAFDMSATGAIQFEEYMWTHLATVRTWKGNL
jgi:antitoxin (DNA-binding transcriptional repressor) of toxin-antitoxin stability system